MNVYSVTSATVKRKPRPSITERKKKTFPVSTEMTQAHNAAFDSFTGSFMLYNVIILSFQLETSLWWRVPGRSLHLTVVQWKPSKALDHFKCKKRAVHFNVYTLQNKSNCAHQIIKTQLSCGHLFSLSKKKEKVPQCGLRTPTTYGKNMNLFIWIQLYFKRMGPRGQRVVRRSVVGWLNRSNLVIYGIKLNTFGDFQLSVIVIFCQIPQASLQNYHALTWCDCVQLIKWKQNTHNKGLLKALGSSLVRGELCRGDIWGKVVIAVYSGVTTEGSKPKETGIYRSFPNRMCGRDHTHSAL